jgi:hypothetical protein
VAGKASERPLSVLEGGASARRTEPESGEGPSRRILWVLVAALVLALLALGVQARQVDQLEAQVTALTRELGTAQEALEAYESHLGQVRGLVGDLENRLQELRELVSRDPSPPAPEQPGDGL